MSDPKRAKKGRTIYVSSKSGAMYLDIESCGVLNGIINDKSRYAICQGMLPAIVRTNPSTGQREIEKFVDDSEINDWMELNNSFIQGFALTKDQMGFNWGAVRYMMDKEREKIATFQRDDLTEVRFERQNSKTGKIDKVYYSANWDKVRTESDNRVFWRRLLNPTNPVADLLEKV